MTACRVRHTGAMAGDEEWAQRFTDNELTEWSVRESVASRTYPCGSYTAAGKLAARLAEVCDEVDHHAEIDIRYPDRVEVRTWSHDVGGLTDRDLRLARALERAATD